MMENKNKEKSEQDRLFEIYIKIFRTSTEEEQEAILRFLFKVATIRSTAKLVSEVAKKAFS